MWRHFDSTLTLASLDLAQNLLTRSAQIKNCSSKMIFMTCFLNKVLLRLLFIILRNFTKPLSIFFYKKKHSYALPTFHLRLSLCGWKVRCARTHRDSKWAYKAALCAIDAPDEVAIAEQRCFMCCLDSWRVLNSFVHCSFREIRESVVLSKRWCF